MEQYVIAVQGSTMSEIKLYRVDQSVAELESSKVQLEKNLQDLIEDNMETFFGVRFLKSEYVIKDGRMDSIGIDENNCPVIFEYKRSQNENVINQGLFYLDWLLDHKADFKLLVLEKLGLEVANSVDWSAPSVICVAHEFTKYDLHAVNRMNVNIKLVKYRRYQDDLVLFEHLNTPSVVTGLISNVDQKEEQKLTSTTNRTHVDNIDMAPPEIQEVYKELCNFIESFGDDISKNQLKYYLAYKKVQNFICIEAQQKQLKVYLKLKPDSVDSIPDLTIRDVTNIGHFGTGDVEITIKQLEDLEKAKELLERTYNEA